MVEATVLILVIAAFVSGGLAVWGSTGGPPRHRLGLIQRVIVLGLLGTLLISAAAWKLSNSHTFQFFGGIVPRVSTSLPVVALTFDDGPSSQFTVEILWVLRDQKVKATFFVTGQAVEENMDAARGIVEEGHELGNHSHSHQRMVLRSYPFIQQEVEATGQLIRTAGYEGDFHFRSPYGKKLLLLPYYLNRTGRLNILFDVEPESYSDIAADADGIVEHVVANTRPGSIILLHVMAESRTESRKAIPGIIQGLREEGYSFVTVSELLALR